MAPTASINPPALLALPIELIHHIFSYLDAYSLADVSATCTTLHACANYDQLWRDILHESLPHPVVDSPTPCKTFRDLFVSLYPYWFIPRNKIWFADNDAYGRLIIARYDPRRICIEAYAVTARRDSYNFQFWEHDPGVVIHSFSPRVGLDLNQPVLKIDADMRGMAEGNKVQKEIFMDVYSGGSSRGAYSLFMLARQLSPNLIGPGTQVWPPHIIPARQRTRNSSGQKFTAIGHKPSKFSEVSDSTFRIRTCAHYASRFPGLHARMAEEVATYSTLPVEIYTPTKEKPWQGIWVGDYADHGCEFLVIVQPDAPGPLPSNFYPPGQYSPSAFPISNVAEQDLGSPSNTIEDASSTPDPVGNGSQPSTSVLSRFDSEHVCTSAPTAETLICRGRLEAIKLTGDPNVPRGQYTFIAPDIGDKGLVRIATEEMFRGARIVRSRGHVAQRGFHEDGFISSQLILISPNKIAQYWEDFVHISMYERVNIDDFTAAE